MFYLQNYCSFEIGIKLRLIRSDDTIDTVKLSTKVMRILFAVLLMLSVLITLGGCNKNDQPAISIEQAWIREAPPNASAMAGYMRIINSGNQASTLVAAASDDFKVIEFHRSVERNGVYRMIRHENLLVPAKEKLELKPGDYHLMMITPKRALIDGNKVSVRLTFMDQSEITVEMPVKKAVFN